ncbi:hypothetical protein Tco_0532113 [Tanacetum coccineum]
MGESLESYLPPTTRMAKIILPLRINIGTGYDNQRANNVAGARENVVKDAAYHKEKNLLCKQEEAEVQLNAEQTDLKDDTDDGS